MEHFYKLIAGIIFSFVAVTIHAQTDFFGISSVRVGEEEYGLKWSAKIHETRFIEEFMLSKESYSTRYKTKIIMDYDMSKSLEAVTRAKLSELKERLQEGSVLNFRIVKNTIDEIVIEYMAGNKQDNKLTIAEWNVYRYKYDRSGPLLFAMSKRAYGTKDVKSFMKQVEKNREAWIQDVLQFELPKITVKE